jgi:hypothetical protein
MDKPRPHNPEVQNEGFNRLLGLHDDAARRRKPQRIEEIGDPRGTAIDIVPGKQFRAARSVSGLDGDGFPVVGEGTLQYGEDIVVNASAFTSDLSSSQ